MVAEDIISPEEDITKVFVCFVNGKKVEDPSIDPEWTLLHYLRYKLYLTGTKLACGEGGCGACTVMVSNYCHRSNVLRHYTVNACLTPLASVHGKAVTTVEGIGNLREGLHATQERIAKSHGSQCGFCTPGMVMSMYTLLRNNPSPSVRELQEYLTGNLCRCTGYRPILDGFGSFLANKGTTGGCGRKDCCQLRMSNGETPSENGSIINGDGDDSIRDNNHLFDPGEMKTQYDPKKEIIFPPELKVSDLLQKQTLQFTGPRVTYWRPTSLKHLLSLKNQYPEAKIIVGNTEVGVEVNFKNQLYPVLINGSHVPEMTCVKVDDSGLEIGAALTLTDLQATLNDLINSRTESETRSMAALVEMLHWFAGRQIRNVASIGGNIMTSSPISDLNPILMAGKASLTFSSMKGGSRTLPFDENFFVSYRKNVALPQEVLTSIHIPFMGKDEFMKAYKQSRRRDDDIAIVNAAIRVQFHPGTSVVSKMMVVLGGMAPTTVVSKTTTKELEGLTWNKSLLEKGTSLLAKEFTLPPSAPGGMVQYRQTLVLSFFFKFYLSVCHWLSAEMPGLVPPLLEDELLATRGFQPLPAEGSQVFERRDDGKNDPVGRPLIHNSALKQATGEAIYVDDIPSNPNELHAAFVFSSRAHAKITKLDPSAALEMEGVEAFFSAQDLPGERNIAGDEEVFRRETIQSNGQVMGMVVARDQDVAKRAAKKVLVDYEDLPNPIYTIEDAIKANSMQGSWTIHKGDLEEGFLNADHTLEGEMYMGGQEHFYMETNSHVAVAKEGGELEVFTSSQSLACTQKRVSWATGIPANKIAVRIKRLGGGFGGKETRTVLFSVPVAVAALKLNRTVRTVVDRHEDMVATGGRSPFLCQWKVGVTSQGKLTALKATLYCDGGYSSDLSVGVVIKSLSNFDNAYRHTNFEITGYLCKTNLPSNTAFRGFGAPQATMFIEDIMTRVATHIGMDPMLLREMNMYETGDLSILSIKLENCNVRRCWSEVMEQADVQSRTQVIRDFNRTNRYRKRGMAVIPLNYGVSNFITQCQGGALVHIYRDGSVLLTHGGVEMGQGLHIKLLQVASRVLDIPIEEIHISETATDKVPNASPTAASVSSDIYGMAVLEACQTLKERLEPFRKRDPEGAWKGWIKAAYRERISLSCTGFYIVPDISLFDFKTQTGKPYAYYSNGAAVSEVEIDCLTGDHVILRTDIVMDVGKSLNPAIDIGQIEGAFMQGVGLVTLEELLYSPEGQLVTKGPGAYKIPGFQDIPGKLHVTLLKDAPNPRAVYSSKGIGEPPLVLAVSVFQALKSAIRAAREDQGLKGIFRLDSPATAERIRMACQDILALSTAQK